MDIRSGDFGEIEVINHVLDALNMSGGHIVEIGAWDGIKHSNIYHLIQQGWAGTLIEKDPNKFQSLEQNMKPYKIKCICAGISLEEDSSINAFIPQQFDLFSLDIDGLFIVDMYRIYAQNLVPRRPSSTVLAAVRLNPALTEAACYPVELQ